MNVCGALLLTTLKPVAEGGYDHDHGCKLPAGHDQLRDAHDALHECIRCGERWASTTAHIDGSGGSTES